MRLVRAFDHVLNDSAAEFGVHVEIESAFAVRNVPTQMPSAQRAGITPNAFRRHHERNASGCRVTPGPPT